MTARIANLTKVIENENGYYLVGIRFGKPKGNDSASLGISVRDKFMICINIVGFNYHLVYRSKILPVEPEFAQLIG